MATPYPGAPTIRRYCYCQYNYHPCRCRYRYRCHDRYRCPRGHFLYPYQKVEVNSVRRYRMLGGHCRHCPLKQQCLPASQQYRSRFVYRNLYQDEIDQVRRRQETAYFKYKLTERMWKIERSDILYHFLSKIVTGVLFMPRTPYVAFLVFNTN